MAGSTESHRSPRGRTSRGHSKKLPPIPERSLSNQNVRSSTLGVDRSRGLGGPSPESINVTKAKNRGTRPTKTSSDPTSSSRSRAKEGAPHVVLDVDSRDDDSFPHQIVFTDETKDVAVAKPIKDIAMPPSPPAAVASPKVTDTVKRAIDQQATNATFKSKTLASASRNTNSFKSTTQATQTNSDTMVLPSVTPRSGIGAGKGVVNYADNNLASAITPFTSNVSSRKSISAVVGTAYYDKSLPKESTKKYATEPSWKGYKRTVSEQSTEDIPDEYPEITSIPTDEILDASMKSKKKTSNAANHNGSNNILPDEDRMDKSRETRDNYQLGRLQARINRRRERGHRQVTEGFDDGLYNYKTIRSSRIKSVRNLYRDASNEPRSQIGDEYQTPLSCTSSITASVANASSSHGLIANHTMSTIPSLQHGQTISHSLTSSTSGFEAGAQTASHHSGAQSVGSKPSPSRKTGGDESTADLSACRGPLFAKMLFLLQEVQGQSPSPNHEILVDSDDFSSIKERVLDEGKKSSCSVAELNLLQKLTEEEMSRILHEFEQNNSLVERNTSHGSTPEHNNDPVQNGIDNDEHSEKGRSPPAHVYHDTSPSIVSKFSDVTSPTCHDGFELDEIMPVPHHRSTMHSSPSSPTRSCHSYSRKRLPPLSSLPSTSTLSPAAAAAASVAASMSLSATGNNARDHPGEHHPLPSVLEIPDKIELNESDKLVKKRQLSVSMVEEVRDEPSSENKDEDKATADLAEPSVEELEVREENDAIPEMPLMDDENVNDLTNEEDNDGFDYGEEADTKMKAACVLASSRNRARRMLEENDFHDEILGAVAKAAESKGDDGELWEVTSILSQYDEKKTEEQTKFLRAQLIEELEGVLSQRSSDENESTTSYDEKQRGASPEPTEGSPNMMALLKTVPPSSQIEDQAMCGCTIQ